MQKTTIHVTDTAAYLTERKTSWRLPGKLPAGGLGEAAARAHKGLPPVEGAVEAELPDDAHEALLVANGNIIIRGAIPVTVESVCRFAGWATRTMLASRADAAELVSINKVAEFTGVAYNRAHAWLMLSPNAPEPIDPGSKRPLWRWTDVRAYLLGPNGPSGKLIDRWREEDRIAEMKAAVDG